MVGGKKGKKFSVQMDMTKAESLLGKLQEGCDNEDDLLKNLNTGNDKKGYDGVKKGEITSFDELAKEEIDMVNKRLGNDKAADAAVANSKGGLETHDHPNPETSI